MERRRGFTGDVASTYDIWLRRPIFIPNAAEVERRLPKSATILDLACGQCVVAERIALRRAVKAGESAPKIVGADRNLDMLKGGAQRASFYNIPLVLADALALPFQNESFDAVVCQFGWMFFDPKSTAYSEALRVLKPGGTLVYSTWASMVENGWGDVAREGALAVFPDQPATYFDFPFSYSIAEDHLSELNQAGFTDIEHSPVDLELQFSSAFAFANGYARSNAAVMNMAQDKDVDIAVVVDSIQTQAAARFGDQPMKTRMKSTVFTAKKAK